MKGLGAETLVPDYTFVHVTRLSSSKYDLLTFLPLIITKICSLLFWGCIFLLTKIKLSLFRISLQKELLLYDFKWLVLFGLLASQLEGHHICCGCVVEHFHSVFFHNRQPVHHLWINSASESTTHTFCHAELHV